jgi:hypothetical protein
MRVPYQIGAGNKKNQPVKKIRLGFLTIQSRQAGVIHPVIASITPLVRDRAYAYFPPTPVPVMIRNFPFQSFNQGE